jgi:hypothetical protein
VKYCADARDIVFLCLDDAVRFMTGALTSTARVTGAPDTSPRLLGCASDVLSGAPWQMQIAAVGAGSWPQALGKFRENLSVHAMRRVLDAIHSHRNRAVELRVVIRRAYRNRWQACASSRLSRHSMQSASARISAARSRQCPL